jgi:hypothetical protein
MRRCPRLECLRTLPGGALSFAGIDTSIEAEILNAALVSIIKLDNLRSKAKMRLITGEELFGARQFETLRGRPTALEELSVVGSSCPWLLE